MKTVCKTKILRQETGSFSDRYAIGPARWPHFDLLWIHEGRVRLQVGDVREVLELEAPDGVLLFPDTLFKGQTLGAKAEASICHFTTDTFDGRLEKSSYLKPQTNMALHVQNLLRLSLYYATKVADEDQKVRLLHTILDVLELREQNPSSAGRVEAAWNAAESRLGQLRSLADVADLVGLRESSFRALHRTAFDHSAGQHLRDLRLKQAERLLATSGDSVSEISKQIGYSSPESFSTAFKRKHGRTPLAFRRWARNFA